jgi:hypothetical protein
VESLFLFDGLVEEEPVLLPHGSEVVFVQVNQHILVIQGITRFVKLEHFVHVNGVRNLQS